jgi:2-dehydropantoate 2-reductase
MTNHVRFASLTTVQRSYAIIGTGALGGFYGARLQHASCDLHFLLHSDYEYVYKHGLICESKDGDFTLPRVNAYRDVGDMPRCDVVCVTLKTTQNHLLPGLLPPVVKDNGAVLVMQNGLGIEDEVAKIVGPQRVVGGLCFLCSNKVGPGHIRHLDYGHVVLGEFSQRGLSDRIREIADDFQRAGIDVGLAEDLAVGRWQKLAWNIPYNGLSVILNATTAELMTNAHTRTLVEQIMWEVVTDGCACGVAVPDETVATMLDKTVRMKSYRTSMKIDFDEHRPMEVEAIFGNPLRAAQQARAKSPLIETLYQQLKFMDTRNCDTS